ncbi:hypothetical protein SEA_DONNY_34 [Mycobacterium phage Donny]|uniref:Uncharacterized protein n=2 Tax=Acadianvirus acadian TaxID=1982901 RepID=A0A481VRQ9_9CAUD|nr:hypothetical protein CM14_gp34 [Mycobacterium phage Acadian]AER48948.1 hypothetical protein ACADIAN_34 [Mycobacterium phage Acadian]QBI96489.1 hypothetical protein SEA_DONNY_34 [Mycobacterium phage Donny]WUT94804.1 hypothetical protein PRODRIGUEZ_34 [Mycobacterium phage PRodriguez]
MSTPTPQGTDYEWAVIWQVATLPDDGTVPDPPERPARPELPLPTYDPQTGNPIPPELTPLQQQLQDQYVADLEAYEAAVAAREEVVDQVLADPANWQSALTVLPGGEVDARAALKTLVEANRDNKYAKDFQLATAPARIWTATT